MTLTIKKNQNPAVIKGEDSKYRHRMKVVETSLIDRQRSLEFLGDVSLPVSVELGSAEITIRRLLALQPGSILELQSTEGEPLAIKAGNRIIARGEVVTLNDHYAVRLTEIADPADALFKKGVRAR